MRRRLPLLVTAVALALVVAVVALRADRGGGPPGAAGPGRTTGQTSSPTPSESPTATSPAPTSAPPSAGPPDPGCTGVARAQVRGPDPAYTRKALSRYPNDALACEALWLLPPEGRFVPQGVVVEGATAWVSGFLYTPGYGNRPCRLVQVDLATGRRLDVRSVVGSVGDRRPGFCRHGGGLVAHEGRLWVAEKNRLWQVDVRRPGAELTAERVWRLERPVLGSALVATADRLGVVGHRQAGPAAIHWYRWDALTAPGVLELGGTPRGSTQVGAEEATPIPSRVQGAAIDPLGRLLLTRSDLRCGELLVDGRRTGFVPGTEGVQVSADGTRLWATSESGSPPYARRPGRPMTPQLVSYAWPQLAQGQPSTCDF